MILKNIRAVNLDPNTKWKKGLVNKEVLGKIIRMRKEDYAYEEIGAETGIPWPTVQYYCLKNNIESPTEQGRKNAAYKIAGAAKTIEKMRKAGKEIKAIANEVSVSVNAVGWYCRKNRISPIKEILSEGYKRCGHCNEVKMFSEFHKNHINETDGFCGHCKKCHKVLKEKYYSNPINRINRKRQAAKRRENPVVRAAQVLYIKTRKRIDPQYRLGESISSAIRVALRGNKNGQGWETLVGYTCQELKVHLEKLFKPGMTWANWGKGSDKWNVDHILPKSRFNYEKPTDIDFKRCWALSNLQPMWEIDNMSKRDRITKDFQSSLQLEVV